MIQSNAVTASVGRACRVLTATLSLALGLVAQQANAQTTWGSDYSVSQYPSNIKGVASVTAGVGNIGVIEYGGLVRCWGEEDDGQTMVPDGLRAKKLSAGQFYFAAVTTGGGVVCWGNNGFHQCDVPSGLTDVTSVATGSQMVVALKSDGTTVTWGAHGSPWVPNRTNMKQVSAFQNHYIFVDRNGRVTDHTGLALGSNAKYAAAGGYHVIILHPDGTVACAGQDSDGQCDVPSGLTGVTQVAAGGNWSMALKSDGSIVTWGGNESGQLNSPSGTGYSQIAAGYDFGIGIKSIQISAAPSIIGGQSGLGTIILADKAPAGGETVSLSSDDAVLTIPSSVTIPEGLRSASFTIDASVPVSDTDVVLTATDTLTSTVATTTIRVTTPSVNAFVNVDTFVGGSDRHIVLEVDVPNAATSGGLPVTLSSDNAAVTVPATTTIRNGQTSVKLVLDHERVHADTDVTITYSIPGSTNSLILHLKPFEIQKMYFTPSEIIGDTDCQLHIVLNAEPKNFAPIALALSSSDPSILNVPATANTMGQGVTLWLTTNAVHKIWIVTVTATLDGSQKKARITIDP